MSLRHLILILFLLLTTAFVKAQIIDPEPVSGKTFTRNFINRSLVYPEQDLQDKLSGKVIVGLHIDKNGKASDFAIIESFSEEASKTAIDLVRKIEWNPATQDGVAMDEDYQYEVVFNAKSYKRGLKRRVTLPLTHPADTSFKVYDNRQTDEWSYPYFEDGNNLATYITNSMNYPPEAKQREIAGTVKLSFIVETDGNVSNIVVTEHVGGGCDNEAIRLIENTRWIPAVKDGQYVRTRIKQDVTFGIGSHNFIDGNNY